MKKCRILVAAVAALMVSFGVANAQTTVSVGVALPQGDFGSQVYGPDFALSYPNGTVGGAATGFQIGLKQQFKVPLIGLSFFASADFMYNGLAESFKSDAVLTEVTYPNYINVPLMLGANYQFNFTPLLGIYVEAGAGLNARFITKSETTTNAVVTNVTTTTTYSPAFTFAYQFGAGVKLVKLVSVGVNYYSLGSAPVKGKASGSALGVSGETSEITRGTLNPGILALRVGFSF